MVADRGSPGRAQRFAALRIRVTGRARRSQGLGEAGNGSSPPPPAATAPPGWWSPEEILAPRGTGSPSFTRSKSHFAPETRSRAIQ